MMKLLRDIRSFRAASIQRAVALAGVGLFLVGMVTSASADGVRKPSTSLASAVLPPAQENMPDLGDGYSQVSSLSYTGRYVAYESRSANLTADARQLCLNSDGSQQPCYEIFLLDRGADMSTTAGDSYADDAMSVMIHATGGGAPDNHSNYPILWRDSSDPARDGHSMVFQSLAGNLVDGDANNKMDVFLYQWITTPGDGTLTRVSVPDQGRPQTESNGHSGGPLAPSLDPSGQYNHLPVQRETLHNAVHSGADLYLTGDGHANVVFESSASNLTAEDSKGKQQIFVRDVDAASTKMLSRKAEDGEVANQDSTQPVVSSYDDPEGTTNRVMAGRFVAFTSKAYNLIPGTLPDDYAGHTNVYLLDRDFNQNGILDEFTVPLGVKVYLLSGRNDNSLRLPGNNDSEYPSIAVAKDGDGNKRVRVVFQSFASDLSTTLADPDTNNAADIYMADLVPGNFDVSLYRISRSSCVAPDGGTGCDTNTNAQTDLDSLAPSISTAGNVVSFTSYATNLVTDDNNFYCFFHLEGRDYFNCPDIFARDVSSFTNPQWGSTWRVSLTAAGRQAQWNSALSRLNGNGRYAAFASFADLRASGDRLNYQQVYLRDQGFPPGNPVVSPNSGEFFAYVGQSAELTFKFTFLDTVVMTGDARKEGRDSNDFNIMEDSCSPIRNGYEKTEAGKTCTITMRFYRLTTDLGVRQAQLVFPLSANDPRGELRIDLRGYAVNGYIPLITP
jgi:hypothetical protein